jgi:PAS domain S-box-containing protein
MYELARVALENEMDLILAHKRSMKLAELSGLSLSAQTTFATAVSEVARNTIENGKNGCLILNVDTSQRDCFIVACLQEDEDNTIKNREGLEYAKRLVNKYNVSTKGSQTSVELFYYICPPFHIDLTRVDEWRSIFRNEPSISPYEEIKRKNELLQELSDKVQKSEAQYKILTNSLPLVIFSLDADGKLLYSNEWLTRFTGESIESLNKTKWQSVVHPNDIDSFSLLFEKDIKKGAATIKTQSRLKNIESGEYFWHQISLSPLINDKGELQYWIGYIVDIHAEKIVEETLKDNRELKEAQHQLKENHAMLERYIEELNRSNHELQQFAYVASHDLQEPVRKMLYYSDYLVRNFDKKVDERGLKYLSNIHSSASRMRSLISDVLSYSQINLGESGFKMVDLNIVAQEALQDLEMVIGEKKATINIQQLPVIYADEQMMRQLFENLLSNSIKYSKADVTPIIDITCKENHDSLQLSFSDNGIGFDEKYLPQMFALFQRLNRREDFEGTGIGLAICKKIMDIHHGKIWAKGELGKGATFYISFLKKQ